MIRPHLERSQSQSVDSTKPRSQVTRGFYGIQTPEGLEIEVLIAKISRNGVSPRSLNYQLSRRGFLALR